MFELKDLRNCTFLGTRQNVWFDFLKFSFNISLHLFQTNTIIGSLSEEFFAWLKESDQLIQLIRSEVGRWSELVNPKNWLTKKLIKIGELVNWVNYFYLKNYYLQNIIIL